jgi:FMN reductase [NAD(P)H]
MSKCNINGKEILTMNETLKLMAAHASVRKYKDQDIPSEILNQIITAARQAPTSSNLQAYSIIIVKDKNKKEKLAGYCGNQVWIKNCPVFLAICPDLHRLDRVCQYRDYQIQDKYIELLLVAAVDAALVAQNILLGAQSLGLGGVMIGAIRNNPAPVCELLNLPVKVFPLVGICLGYPDTKPMIKPRFQPELVIHHEQYDDSRFIELIKDYDMFVKSTGLYEGPRRKVAPIDSREIPDEEYSWTEHTARRVGSDKPSVTRAHMREFLQARQFGLE